MKRFIRSRLGLILIAVAAVALAAGAAALLRAEYTIDTMEWEELAIPLPELPTGAA